VEKYKKVLGNFGEQYAAKFLKKNKYKILQTNYNIRGGEIDIIAQKGDYVIFVEVKTRKDKTLGTGAEAVTYTKRQRIIKAAEHYILSNGNCNARFDVIEVYGNIENERFNLQDINHIENAF